MERAARPDANGPMSPWGALRVVIADDAATMRALLRHVLATAAAFRVVGEAADGEEEAVRVAASEQPDMLLLDLAMPVLDGLGAIPRIRACSPATRIVVLSGFSNSRMARRALDVGADAYLEKRERPDELLAHLIAVCGPPAVADPYRAAFDHAPIGIAIDGRAPRSCWPSPPRIRVRSGSRRSRRWRSSGDARDRPRSACGAGGCAR